MVSIMPSTRFTVGVDGAGELERVYREEATRIRASLAARLGDVGLAEELVQDAFIEALEHWRVDGVPPNPGGWLATTARRKGIDRLRRDRAGQHKLALLAITESRQAGDPSYPHNGPDQDDDLLSLVFACCHPSLPRESQIALTLRVVCGLATAEIAAAFLVSEQAMAQRLARARKALRDTGADVRVPDPDRLGDRRDEVLTVIYLVFNEGYLASAGRTPARRDLASQAVALNRLLQRLRPREPEVLGLLALLLLHESRAATRFDGWGRLVRLQDQDRTRWDLGLAAEASELLSRAIAMHRPGQYQIQAAIALVHAQASTYEDTDWSQIRVLYDRLCLFDRSFSSTARSRRGSLSGRRKHWPRSNRWPASSTDTGCSTRCEPGCSPSSAVRTRPGRRTSERSHWPLTRPNASCSPAASQTLHRHDGPDLHDDQVAVHARPGLGDLHGLVDGVGLEHRVAAQDLLRLHEWAVEHAAGLDRLDLFDRVELVPGVGKLAGAPPLLIPGADLLHPRLEVGARQLLARLGDQPQ
jgi:RNA polymerase sigma factor (sigma-70 family)